MKGLSQRRLSIIAIFGAVTLIFVVRLFFLQVLSPEFSASAQENVVKKVVIQPARGIIYDRNGKQYVTNEPIFDLTVVPRELQIRDTALLCQQLGLTREELRLRIQEAFDYSKLQPSVLKSQIHSTQFARLQESLWQFEGVNTVVRNMRSYQDTVGANILGYINEVNRSDIDRSKAYYQQGDLIGRSGLERYYEPYLRGRKGVKMILKDVHGREVGAYAGGRLDTMPEKGQDIMISIDLDLQRYGEMLMRGKIGSIVAIEPPTGEILAFVSSPSYDPNLLMTGDWFAKNYRRLERDSLLPLFNRPLQAMYPPGSIFKTLSALAALEEGTLTPETHYGCAGGFLRNGGTPGCHGHPTPLAVVGAVQYSCNAFFAATYVDFIHHRKFDSYREGYAAWYNYMRSFGLGGKLGIDIPNEKAGVLYSPERYDKAHGKGKWNAFRTLSNAIGQGEVLMTPLQMANATAMIANRGYYITPHFFKRFFNDPNTPAPKFERHEVPVARKWFDYVVEGMELVVSSGTGIGARVPDIAICGKTGTSQNPHGEDHSVFIAFAPRDNPKIAIAVVIENAGFGGTWAAPIAGLMIEQYLKDTITNPGRESYIRNKFFFPSQYYQQRAKPQPKPQPVPPNATSPLQATSAGREE